MYTLKDNEEVNEKMADIFDATISCPKCETKMQKGTVVKKGYKVRAVQCPKCGERIIHPSDLNNLNEYDSLRNKTYTVKLRVVGNSHTISIPKEILEFMEESEKRMQKQMSDMVRLAFEDFGRLRVEFIDLNEEVPEEKIDPREYDPEIEDDDEKKTRRKNKTW